MLKELFVNEIMNFYSCTTFDVELAIDWLIDSGIQNSEGAFYAWYDMDKEKYSFLYPEITAYAIQILSRLHIQNYKSTYLTRAVKAGDWLLKNQKDDGSFFCKQFAQSEAEKNDDSFYVFDAGIITCGFLDLYKITSKKKYLTAAIKASNLILRFQNSDGSLHAGRNPDGTIINNPHWSQTSSCHHIKMLLPCLRLHAITKDEKYLDFATKLLQWGHKLQVSTGRFVTFLGSSDTYTHAHCYAIEGLMEASRYFDHIKQLFVDKKVSLGVNWLLNTQNGEGSIWNWYGSQENKIKVGDAIAQTIRLLLLSKKIFQPTDRNTTIDEQIHKGLVFLKKLQFLDENRRSRGGISYGETQGKQIKNVSTCATIFAIHAALLRKNVEQLQLPDEIF